MQEEEEKQITELRVKIEMGNLAKMYLQDLIKKECWDAMEVKGRVVKVRNSQHSCHTHKQCSEMLSSLAELLFQAFQMQLEVSNYALKARSSHELKELERVITLRKIEMEDRKVLAAVLLFISF